MVKISFLGFANEKYDFDFEIVNDGRAIHLQDKNGFNFLSVQLFKGQSRLIDDNVADNLLHDIRNFSQDYLNRVRESWIQEQRVIEETKYFEECVSKRKELKIQFDNCSDDLEKDLICVQIKRLDEIIEEFHRLARIDY
jgi:hypothetical protein